MFDFASALLSDGALFLSDGALLLCGSALLFLGARGFSAGTVGLARGFGASERVIGAAILPYVTSAPSLSVSLSAALHGKSALVLGNVIGGNIVHIGLALGLAVVIAPARVNPALFRREVPYLLIATLAAGPILLNRRIDRAEATLFLVSALAFTAVSLHRARRAPAGPRPEQEPAAEPARGPVWCIVLTVLGIGALVVGGRWLVGGAAAVARALEVSERLVALTLVALATSLPVLSTALASAIRGRSHLVVGQVVGATSFNLLFVLGLSSLLVPIEGALAVVRIELVVMTVLTFLMALAVRSDRTITRTEGAVLLLGALGGFGGLLARP